MVIISATPIPGNEKYVSKVIDELMKIIKNLINEGKLKPELIIGVPVGFVNVEVSKELIVEDQIPYIVAQGRKGGSNVAAAIVNALLYML